MAQDVILLPHRRDRIDAVLKGRGLMELQMREQVDETVRITEESAAGLRSALHGAMIIPGDAGSDEARSIWNAMVNRRPALIIQAADAADVSRAVNFERDRRAVLSVRGGGHNIAGSAVCEGGVMLDLSRMRWVLVDPTARRAPVARGQLLRSPSFGTSLAGSTTASLSNSFAPVVNAGLAYNIDSHWSIGVSASYLWLSTRATLTTQSRLGTVASTSKVNINPVTTFVSVGYRF